VHLKTVLFSCFIGMLGVFCNAGFSAQESDVETAINRGLAWVLAHPATYHDGGFQDIVDEGLFYLTVRRLTSDNAFDSVYKQAFEACISRLEASIEWEQQPEKQNTALIAHYHLLLAAYIVETFRKPSASHDSVVSQAQRALVTNRREYPTFRLTVALLLYRLGATPQVNMSELLDASIINRATQNDLLMFGGPSLSRPLFQHPLAYYALVHEVAALTAFGDLPAPPWLLARRNIISSILQEGSRRAMAASDIDLLAEILLCNYMLGLPITGELRSGVHFLVANQHADGSWGEQMTHRTNRTRHAAQTATAALLAYQASSIQSY
jgi:hypothetical protein